RPGGTDRSYGIQVARLAGLPAGVIARAREILAELSQTGRAPVSAEGPARAESSQLGLFPSAPDPVLKELLALEISTLTPLQALTLPHEWQQRLRSQP